MESHFDKYTYYPSFCFKNSIADILAEKTNEDLIAVYLKEYPGIKTVRNKQKEQA